MIDLFFTVIELLGDKFDIDSSTGNFKTLVATTIIIETIMVIFCIGMIFIKEYLLTIVMLIIMIAVLIFSKNRIKELKNESRNAE